MRMLLEHLQALGSGSLAYRNLIGMFATGLRES